jgi:hypothetical protein
MGLVLKNPKLVHQIRLAAKKSARPVEQLLESAVQMYLNALAQGSPSSEIHEESHPVPRSELGRKLWDLRSRLVDSGEPLLDWEGIEQEIVERRGERG